MELDMKKIFAVVACLTLALGLAQSMPAAAQSRIPLGLMPSNPLPTDPPMGSLGIR